MKKSTSKEHGRVFQPRSHRRNLLDFSNPRLMSRIKMKDSSTANWSDLPIDLLEKIAKGIDTSIDLRSLRAVCAPWRSSVPPPSALRIKLPSPSGDGQITVIGRPIYHLQLPDASTYSCKGRLVKVEEKKLNKLSHMIPLSSTSEATTLYRFFPKVLNFSDFRVFEVSKAYGVKYVGPTDIEINKVVIGDDVIMAILDGRKLGFMNFGDNNWNLTNGNYYCDVAFRKGKFYAVDAMGRMLEIDLSSGNAGNIKSPLEPFENHLDEDDWKVIRELVSNPDNRHITLDQYLLVKYDDQMSWHLVESFGDLFLVHSNDYDDSEQYDQDAEGDMEEELILDVYKLVDEEEDGRYWSKVTTLDHRALFLGDDCSFSVSADLPGIIENCIYFRKKNSTETFIFEVGKDEEVRPLSTFLGYSQIFKLP